MIHDDTIPSHKSFKLKQTIYGKANEAYYFSTIVSIETVFFEIKMLVDYKPNAAHNSKSIL